MGWTGRLWSVDAAHDLINAGSDAGIALWDAERPLAALAAAQAALPDDPRNTAACAIQLSIVALRGRV